MSTKDRTSVRLWSRVLRYAAWAWGAVAIVAHLAYWGFGLAAGPHRSVGVRYGEVAATPSGLGGFVVTTVVVAAFVGTLVSVGRVAALYEALEFFSPRSVARLRSFARWLAAFVGLKFMSPIALGLVEQEGVTVELDLGELSMVLISVLLLLLTHILAEARAAVDENEQFL